MKKDNHITTAANSKTLNAIEKTKLFAAAVDGEQTINYCDENRLIPKSQSGQKGKFKMVKT